MREVVLDTETTGLDPFAYPNHRLVEIGCVELMNHIPTGKVFHKHINPERDVPEEVVKVHGLTEEFLKDKPTFSEIASDFLEFIGTDPLVIHNAAFDMKFINAELSWAKYDPIPYEQAIDTIQIARKLFPGSRVNLNELCRRFNIDNSKRKYHGALLDSELLAEVYLELLGGKEPALVLNSLEKSEKIKPAFLNKEVALNVRAPRFFPVFEDELKNHEAFMAKLKA